MAAERRDRRRARRIKLDLHRFCFDIAEVASSILVTPTIKNPVIPMGWRGSYVPDPTGEIGKFGHGLDRTDRHDLENLVGKCRDRLVERPHDGDRIFVVLLRQRGLGHLVPALLFELASADTRPDAVEEDTDNRVGCCSVSTRTIGPAIRGVALIG